MLMIDGSSKATSRTKEMEWKNTLLAPVFDVGLHFKEDAHMQPRSLYEGLSLISHTLATCY